MFKAGDQWEEKKKKKTVTARVITSISDRAVDVRLGSRHITYTIISGDSQSYGWIGTAIPILTDEESEVQRVLWLEYISSEFKLKS